MLSARQAALSALRKWRTKPVYADAILVEIFDRPKLEDSDRAFVLELFYGTLRNLTLLDFWIACLRASRLDVDLRDILRLGLYQLLLAETPEHAAVYETVELARNKQRGVINAILRNAARRRQELVEKAKGQPLSIRTSHADFLITRWNRNWGARNTEALCSWNNRPPPIYARINRLKTNVDDFLRTYRGLGQLLHDPNFVEFRSLDRVALAQGHCYVQDASTALACRLLDPRPEEKILDACAAPGGKTSYLAETMENRGMIVACDRDVKRLAVLKENLARLGVTIARFMRCDWTYGRPPKEIVSVAPFDRILVDAPCSNTGVMRRRVDVRWRLRPDDFQRMPEQQMSILRALTPLLKKSGTLVYSTCSLEPEENEQVLKRFLQEYPGFSAEHPKNILPFREQFDGAFAVKLVRIS